MGNLLLFSILAIIAITSALGMVVSRNAVYSALFLILNFVTIGVFFLVLNAPFIAMVQIIVYAGAIMVLFLFVIMLLGAEKLPGSAEDSGWQKPLASLLALVLIGTLVIVIAVETPLAAAAAPIDASPTAIALRFFEAYVFPFEVTAILLLVAMIGVVVLRIRRGKKKNG